MINATEQKPVMICMTCGVATAKVQVRASISLKEETRKTWKRTIKPSFFKTAVVGGKVIRVPQIYYSPMLDECLSKRHKLSVRTKPFHRGLLFGAGKKRILL